MTGWAYYNEIDPFAAAWLRELIKAGLIADGEVDERDIRDVSADDVRGFRQCHFFAGIGGWSYALRLAGWPDDREVWTGSCPCQPFSSAGAQAGGNDPRDLWPAWFQLITQCRPSVVFGEQVEAAIAHGWLDRLCDDLEREGYAIGAAGLPAASVGAPHIRQRLYFVAQSECSERSGRDGHLLRTPRAQNAEGEPNPARQSSVLGELAESVYAERLALHVSRSDGRDGPHGGREEAHGESGTCGEVCELADAYGALSSDSGLQRSGRLLQSAEDATTGELGDTDHARSQGRERVPERAGECATRAAGLAGFWSACDWLPCRDGKARPVEPGTFPLASRVSARVGRLRGYGNAIVPQVAAEFIKAYADQLREHTA